MTGNHQVNIDHHNYCLQVRGQLSFRFWLVRHLPQAKKASINLDIQATTVHITFIERTPRPLLQGCAADPGMRKGSSSLKTTQKELDYRPFGSSHANNYKSPLGRSRVLETNPSFLPSFCLIICLQSNPGSLQVANCRVNWAPGLPKLLAPVIARLSWSQAHGLREPRSRFVCLCGPAALLCW